MARKTKEEALKTRESILNSALDLFDKKGYSGTTLNEIAKALGMTKGAVYWHFSSKYELFETLLRELDSTFNKILLPFVWKVDTVSDLKVFFIEYASLILTNPRIKKIMNVINLKTEWTDETSEIITRLDTMNQEMEDFCKKKIKDFQKKGKVRGDLDPGVIAYSLTSMVDGILFSSYVQRKDTEYMNSVKAALEIFFSGLTA